MKRLLYIAPVVLNYVKPDGVGKKIIGQVHSFSKSYETKLVSYAESGLFECSNEKSLFVKAKFGFRRLSLYYHILKLLKKEYFDFVYIRYHLADPLYALLLLILKMKGCKIVIEIPTYPYAPSFEKKLSSFLKLFVDRISYPLLHFSVGRIVTYSNDDNIFGIKTIKTLNGIDFNKEKIVTKTFDENNQTISLISVSMTYACHGYDRVIRGLSNYYKENPKVKVCFHIVGKGDEIPKLQSLTKQLHMDEYVFFEGFQTGENLEKIYANSDIAINSLGIHRIGLKSESTLKAKEYCAKGLPIVSSYPLDSLTTEDNNKYVYFVPSNDSSVDIKHMIDFYLNLQQQTNYHQCIRENSSKICDMDVTLKAVRNYFEM